FRVGLKTIVTGLGAAVGLNGGFVHTVQLGANCLPGTECQAWNETKRGHNSGMTPVNRKAGTGERTREPSGGNAWYLYSPVGFRHH
ncbi:hypothetical protein A7R67_01975, partial [Escherichia coli]